MSVTRADLIARLALMAAITTRDAELVLRVVLDEIGAGLAEGQRVELRGFGVFEPKPLPARPARNPQNGEAVMTSAKSGVHFKAAKAMHLLLNGEPDTPAIIQPACDAEGHRDEKAA
ncbi:MAG: HU family DNA-binding protein [Geminicoccaceae bacterium]